MRLLKDVPFAVIPALRSRMFIQQPPTHCWHKAVDWRLSSRVLVASTHPTNRLTSQLILTQLTVEAGEDDTACSKGGGCYVRPSCFFKATSWSCNSQQHGSQGVWIKQLTRYRPLVETMTPYITMWQQVCAGSITAHSSRCGIPPAERSELPRRASPPSLAPACG